MSTIKSSTTTTTAYQVVADTTGTLVFQTGATPTTALTIDASQAVTFAGAVSLSGNQTTTGNLTVNGNTTLGDASTDTILMTGAPSIGGAGLGMGMGFRNRIINGAMVIDQRNAGASVSVDGVEVYTLDRWKCIDGSDGVFSVQQDSSAPAGFNNSLKVTVTTADASIGATQYAIIRQVIEGFNFADFEFGTASAKTVTISFWVRSSLTGTFGGCLWNSNGGSPRCYPFTYTISAANTWEQKSVTIVGDQSGTWIGATNGSSAVVDFTLAMGSTYSGPAGAWAGSLYLSATGATQVISTNGATWYVTGVQLEKGSTATSFDYRPYGTELALCQRYFQKDFQGTWGATYSASDALLTLVHAVSMRANATLSQASGVNISIDIVGGAQNATSQGITGGGSSLTRTGMSVAGLTGRSTYQPVAIANTGTQLSAEL